MEINVSATVYSFHALMNTKIRAVTIPGAATGRRIRIRARNLSAAVYGSCLFHFRRNGDKGTAQQPDCKCLVKCCIDKYQPYETVCHAKSGHDFVDTYQKDNRCKHLRNNDNSQEDFFTFEFHSCKCIGCRDTTYASRSEWNHLQRSVN